MAQRFQRAVGIEHAAASGTQHVPGEIEQPEPRSVKEAGNHPLFIEPGPRRKIQQVDPVELVVPAVFDQLLDRIGHRRVGRLFQYSKLRLGVAQAASLEQITQASKQCLRHRRVMRNIGERSGCVVTTPTGSTGSFSRSSTRNAPISLASANVASTSAKCAPMQTRAPTPNGR